MGNKWVKRIFAAALALFMLAIVIPQGNVKIFGKEVKFRGLRPQDIIESTIWPDFKFSKGLDFEEHRTILVKVTLTEDIDDKQSEMTRVRDIIAYRLETSGLQDFDIRAFVATEGTNYVLLKLPLDVADQTIYSVLSKGEVAFWSVDQASSEEVQAAPSKFVGRSQLPLSNRDVAFAKVIADSRVQIDERAFNSIDPAILSSEQYNKTKNLGLEIGYAQNSENTFLLYSLLYGNVGGLTPTLITIDNVPVAIESSYSSTALSRLSGFYYTLSPDDRQNNYLLAALLTSPSIEHQLSIVSNEITAPVHSASLAQTRSAVGLVLLLLITVPLLSRVNFKYRYFINVVYALTCLSMMLIFSNGTLILSFALAMGVALATIYFAGSAYQSMLKIDEKTTSEDLENIVAGATMNQRNVTILMVGAAFLMQYFGTREIDAMATGIGFGMIAGLLVWLVFGDVFAKLFVNVNSEK